MRNQIRLITKNVQHTNLTQDETENVNSPRIPSRIIMLHLFVMFLKAHCDYSNFSNAPCFSGL